MEVLDVTMPLEVTMVRHGLSKPNEAQRADKRGEDMTPHLEVFNMHDFRQELAEQGIQQAQTAGNYMRANDMDPKDFDRRDVTMYNRGMQTAAYLSGQDDCEWLPEIRLIERDWGSYGAMTIKERQERYPDTERMKTLSPFFARFDGGESMHDVVYRVRDYLNTLNREATDQRVLAVTHGELMWAARFVIERMTPHEWQDLDGDKTQRIGNCAILQYSRMNPEDPEDVKRSLSNGWRRMLNPLDPDNSPFDGEWVKLPGKRLFTPKQLLQMSKNN